MKKNLISLAFCLFVFSTAYSQRIIHSAINQYPSCNDIYYNFDYDDAFERVFKLSDSSIITISTNKEGLTITKWKNDLVILDKKELLSTSKINFYYSAIINNVIYLFGYQDIDTNRVFFHHEISVKDSVNISPQKYAIKAKVVANDSYTFYALKTEMHTTTIEIINLLSLATEKIAFPIENESSKHYYYEVTNNKNYIVFVFRTRDTSKKKEPSNSVLSDIFVFEKKTKKINKPDVKNVVEVVEGAYYFEVTSVNDSLYFIRYSNKDDHLMLKYKIAGYDFGADKKFLDMNSTIVFSKPTRQKDLATKMFRVDTITGNLILMLERYAYQGKMANGAYSENFYRTHMDYALIYMDGTGKVINTAFVPWPQTVVDGQQTAASCKPKIFFIDGLTYFFVSNYQMKTMTCFVFDKNGVQKDVIKLFELDKADSNNVNTSTIHYLGNGVFSFATIPNKFGKTGSFYTLKYINDCVIFYKQRIPLLAGFFVYRSIY